MSRVPQSVLEVTSRSLRQPLGTRLERGPLYDIQHSVSCDRAGRCHGMLGRHSRSRFDNPVAITERSGRARNFDTDTDTESF